MFINTYSVTVHVPHDCVTLHIDPLSSSSPRVCANKQPLLSRPQEARAPTSHFTLCEGFKEEERVFRALTLRARGPAIWLQTNVVEKTVCQSPGPRRRLLSWALDLRRVFVGRVPRHRDEKGLHMLRRD